MFGRQACLPGCDTGDRLATPVGEKRQRLAIVELLAHFQFAGGLRETLQAGGKPADIQHVQDGAEHLRVGALRGVRGGDPHDGVDQWLAADLIDLGLDPADAFGTLHHVLGGEVDGYLGARIGLCLADRHDADAASARYRGHQLTAEALHGADIVADQCIAHLVGTGAAGQRRSQLQQPRVDVGREHLQVGLDCARPRLLLAADHDAEVHQRKRGQQADRAYQCAEQRVAQQAAR